MVMFSAPTTEIVAHYVPLPWQVKPWRDRSRVLLLTGSAGGGKSRLAAEKLHAFCKKYPGAMALALRKTRESAINSIVLFMEKTVIGDDPAVRHVISKRRFEYANGSFLAYGGMKNEEQREQVRSIGLAGGLDIIWMEEGIQFSEADYDEVLGRLRGKAAPWRQVILSTNPDHPKHWINTRLIKGGQAAVYRSGAHDNPHNPPDYLATLDLLTGVRRLRLRDGKWVQAEGAVYADFDYDVHLVDAFPVPAGWRRIRSIDFGYTNPFTCQWWAIDPDGRMYLYREIYKTQVLVEDHADEIKQLGAACSWSEWSELSDARKQQRVTLGERFEATVADHDAEDRATLERHGVPTQPATKDVSPGIQAVQARLRVAGDGKPRLMIMRGALVAEDPKLREAKKPLCLEDEIPGYVWEPAREGYEAKEAPVKLDDHGVDAMRYAVMYLDSAPQRPTWDVWRT